MDLIKRDLKIDERIYSVRGRQVMIDRDLAELYGVETKALNQAVKRNIERFPPSFMFRLKQEEFMELVTICDRFEKLKHKIIRESFNISLDSPVQLFCFNPIQLSQVPVNHNLPATDGINPFVNL